MNKNKTTMEDVAAIFGDFKQKAETKIADMDREQLADALRDIVKTARGHAELAVQFKANPDIELKECRALLYSVSHALGFLASKTKVYDLK